MKLLSVNPVENYKKSHRKNILNREYSALVIEDGEIKIVLTVRTYGKIKSTSVVWIFTDTLKANSSKLCMGSATGNTETLAVLNSFKSAGYELSWEINVPNIANIHDAIKLICSYHGYENIYIHESNA